VRGVAEDNVIAPVFEFIGRSLNLISAVRRPERALVTATGKLPKVTK
jgi:hypothetical protein